MTSATAANNQIARILVLGAPNSGVKHFRATYLHPEQVFTNSLLPNGPWFKTIQADGKDIDVYVRIYQDPVEARRPLA